jgi:hypothetical protein
MAQGSSPSDRPSGTPVPGGSLSGEPSPAPVGDPVGSALDLLKQIVVLLAAVLMGPVLHPSKVQRVRRRARQLVPSFLKLGIGNPVYAPVGEDLPALLQSWELCPRILELRSPVSTLLRQVEETVLQREAEVWKAVMLVYALAQVNAGSDAGARDLVSQMQAALAVGPKGQRVVHTTIKPTPVKGKRAKMAALEPAILEAAKAKVAEAAPAAASPEPAPKPPSDGSGGGPVSGSGR